MTPTRDDIKMMYELNSNIKKLLKIQAANAEEKLLSYDEAERFLTRSRRWIQERVVAEDAPIPKDVDGKLFFQIDYVRFGKQLRFRQASLEKLKQLVISQS